MYSSKEIICDTVACSKLTFILAEDKFSFTCVCKGDIATDDRSYEMHLINAMDVAGTNVYFYPRLIPIVSSSHAACDMYCMIIY